MCELDKVVKHNCRVCNTVMLRNGTNGKYHCTHFLCIEYLIPRYMPKYIQQVGRITKLTDSVGREFINKVEQYNYKTKQIMSKELKVTKEAVLKAASKCTTADNILRDMFPEAFVAPIKPLAIEELRSGYNYMSMIHGAELTTQEKGTKIARVLMKPKEVILHNLGKRYTGVHYMSLYGNWRTIEHSDNTTQLIYIGDEH